VCGVQFLDERVADGSIVSVHLRSAAFRSQLTLWGAWILPGLVGFLVAAAISFWTPPLPNIHDDFGNLLVADTLLHGRLSNPTPPSHELLQTFHVVMQPSYAAKFPIGNGAMMALGQWTFGTLAAGMWLSAGLACACIAWMMAGHFPPGWSCAMGMLGALHPVWQTGWSQEFTQGWLAIAAMSLVLGGLLRIRKWRPTEVANAGRAMRSMMAIAVGLVIGMLTRPFETAMLASLLALALLVPWCKHRAIWSSKFWMAALPGMAILCAGVTFQAVINRSVTGTAMMLPYQLHEQQYGVAPVFVWQQPHEPSLGHKFAEQSLFHRGWSMDAYRSARSWSGYSQLMAARLRYAFHHWGAMLTLCPLALFMLPRERRVYGGLLLSGLIALFLINTIPWVSATYVAPLIPIAMFLCSAVMLAGVRWLAHRSKPTLDTPPPLRMRRLQWLVVSGLMGVQAIGLVACTRSLVQARHSSNTDWSVQRAAIESELRQQPGNQLVIVRYGPHHNIHHEWVFNGADPTKAKIVWARWDEALIPTLLADYPNRSVWLLDIPSDDALALLPWDEMHRDG